MNYCTRREALGSLAAGVTLHSLLAADEAGYQLASFVSEVTVPLGHPLMGGGIAPAQKIDDPLFIHGLVLLGGGKPIVLASIDWCEIRNDAYDQWRNALAAAASTVPERVLLSSVHQHDAPVADLQAQRLLDEQRAAGRVCDIDFHDKTVKRVAEAVRQSMSKTRRITHLGTGQAAVKEVASNRRYIETDGKPRFGRTSATRDPKVRAHPEGTIDPMLKLLSFWDGDQPVAALAAYATHPMSYYGKGGVSADFIGLARKRFQADHPGMAAFYFSGCSGNVTAGKYNDGAPDNRPVLAERIYQAWVAAWQATQRRPLKRVEFRKAELRLAPRSEGEFTIDELKKRLKSDPRPFGQCLAALGLSWRQRADRGQPIDLPAIDFGPAQFVLLPGEAYVEYQLLAQQLRPDAFVLTAGYGECATGYIPTDRAVAEGDANLRDWCWVAPGAEKTLTTALTSVLKPG